MDLLNIIRSKSKLFHGTDSQKGIEAIIHHIEISENHYELAKTSGDFLYTDVIYRTNQAFEGAVKEAYRLLAGGDPDKQKTYDIEKYFESNKTLRPRVLSQFTIYRTEWRNKSTHDYQLFFSSQEALLAIVSVTAFFNILLDQMLEKFAFEKEQEKLKSTPVQDRPAIQDYDQLSFFEQCIEIFNKFSNELRQENDLEFPTTEYELLGRLSAFISAIDPAIEAYSECELDEAHGRLQIDLLLVKNEEPVIVELKKPTMEYHRKAINAKEQLKHYLIAAEILKGIVYAPVLRSSTKTEIERFSIKTLMGDLEMAVMTPPIGKV